MVWYHVLAHSGSYWRGSRRSWLMCGKMASIGTPLLFSMLLLQIALASPLPPGEECQHPCALDGTCLAKKSRDSCYFIFPKVLVNAKENKDFCQNHELAMAHLSRETLDDGFSLSEMMEAFDYYAMDAGVWLGGRSKNLAAWQFYKGDGGGKKFFEDIEIDENQDFAKCGVIHPGSLKVAANECWEKSYSICRYENCINNTICLGLLPVEESWFYALNHCQQAQGELFYLNDNEDFLLDDLSNTLNSTWLNDTPVHIGLIHRQWLWNDGAPITLFNWKDREPNSSEEACLAMDGKGKWKDESCLAVKMAFCQAGSNIQRMDEMAPLKREKEGFVDTGLAIIGAFLAFSVLINVIGALALLCIHCRKRISRSKMRIIKYPKRISHSKNDPGEDSLSKKKNSELFSYSKSDPEELKSDPEELSLSKNDPAEVSYGNDDPREVIYSNNDPVESSKPAIADLPIYENCDAEELSLSKNDPAEVSYSNDDPREVSYSKNDTGEVIYSNNDPQAVSPSKNDPVESSKPAIADLPIYENCEFKQI